MVGKYWISSPIVLVNPRTGKAIEIIVAKDKSLKNAWITTESGHTLIDIDK